jgi:tyrosinase
MRTSFLTATLAVAVGVSALPQITPLTPLAPALPLDNFKTEKFTKLLSLEDIAAGLFKKLDLPTTPKAELDLLTSHKAEFHRLATNNKMATAATCSNPRVRVEWDNASNNDRQAYVSAIRCLMGKPASGQFQFAKSRYEDLVALHQILTPNVHGSSKFLLWHRYYLWTFEDVMRGECGFNGPLLWFDETKYSGRFDQSSIFSDQWFGGINAGGNCITNGVSSHLLCQH